MFMFAVILSLKRCIIKVLNYIVYFFKYIFSYLLKIKEKGTRTVTAVVEKERETIIKLLRLSNLTHVLLWWSQMNLAFSASCVSFKYEQTYQVSFSLARLILKESSSTNKQCVKRFAVMLKTLVSRTFFARHVKTVSSILQFLLLCRMFSSLSFT